MKASQNGGSPAPQSPSPKHTPKRILLTIFATLAGLAVCGVLVLLYLLEVLKPI